MKNIKRLIAVAAVTFGVCFTLLALISIWLVPLDQYDSIVFGKLLPTLGILTVAFMALLAIMSMVEKKNGAKQ